MKKISKRVLKVLLTTLALTMLLCVPASAASKKTVATIGKKSYTSLSSAVKAVKNGQTIKLKSDTTIKSAISRNKKYTIDLNGHTLKGTYKIKDSSIISAHSSTAVRITAGNVTIKNGAISGLYVKGGVTVTLSKIVEPKYWAVDYIYIKKGATVKIKSGTFTRDIVNYGNLTINNGTVKSFDFKNKASGVIKIKGGTFKNVEIKNSGKMTISGGKFTNEGYYSLIYNGDKSQLTIKGGTFKSTSWNCVVSNFSGSLKITGGTFKSTGTTEDSNNAAMGVIMCDYDSKTTITGGKISSKYSNGIYVSGNVKTFKCSGAKITVSSSKRQKICDKR